jgi:exportin-2 (importin alpha re-exporter)
MWLSKGNVPALVRLLNAIIPRATQYLAANNQIEPILGIFKQLLLKGPEIYAFEILESVLTTFPS